MPVNSGKASREVVQTLINNMNAFTEGVLNELRNMINQTQILGESWNDPQYAKFSTFMIEAVESLQKDLMSFQECSTALQRKVDMYNA